MQVKCFPRLRVTQRECRSFLLEFELSLRRATFTSPHRVVPKRIATRGWNHMGQDRDRKQRTISH